MDEFSRIIDILNERNLFSGPWRLRARLEDARRSSSETVAARSAHRVTQHKSAQRFAPTWYHC
jgi:hypothetical protein